MAFALLLLAFACTSIMCDAEIDDNLVVDSNCEGGANTCRASYEDDAVVLLQTKHSLNKDQSVEQTQEDNEEKGKTSQSESNELMEERKSKEENEKEHMKERGLQDGDHDGGGSDGRDDAEEDQDEAEDEKEDEDEGEEEEQEDEKHEEETQELAEEDSQEEDEKEDHDENAEEPDSNVEPEANEEMADNTNSTALLMSSAHVNSTPPAVSVVDVAAASFWPANRIWAASFIAHLMRNDCMKDTAGHCLGRSCPHKYQCYAGICTGMCGHYLPYHYDCGAYCTLGYLQCKHKTLGIMYALGESFNSLLPIGATASKLHKAAMVGRTKFMSAIRDEAGEAGINLALKFGVSALENIPKIALALPGISTRDTKKLLDAGMELIALKAHATKGEERVLCETMIQAVDPTGLTGVYNAFASDKCKWFEELPSLSRRRRSRRRRTWHLHTSAPRTRRRYVHVPTPVRTPSPTPGGPRRRYYYVPASRRRRYTAYVVASGHTSAPGTRRRYVPITTRVR